MAITAIDIIQDNKVGDVDLLASHNPLVFLANATYSGAPPEELVVQVLWFDGVSIQEDNYNAIYLRDDSVTERVFAFIADEAIRLRIEQLADIVQTANTIIAVPNLTENLTIKFDDWIAQDEVEIQATNAAKDFEDENGAAMVDEYNNVSKYYTGAVDEPLYLYWYNNNENNAIIENLNPSKFTFTFNANPINGDIIEIRLERNVYRINANCDNQITIDTITAGTDYTVGATISDTIDNIIAYMENKRDVLGIDYKCLTFVKNGNDLEIYDQSFWHNEMDNSGSTAPVTFATENNIGDFARVQVFLFSLIDGDVVSFNYVTPFGTTVTSMTARTSPTLPNEFLIGGTDIITTENYHNALISLYPEINAIASDIDGIYQTNLYNSSFVDTSSNPRVTIIPTAGVDPPGLMTFDKGFIRKMIEPSAVGITTESININSQEFTHTIKVRDFCEGDVLIKYADRNGQYRFMPFSKYYSVKNTPKEIGSINEFILSLASDEGDKKTVGYKNRKTLTLSVSQLNIQERATIADIFVSSDVLVRLGNKWIRCTVKGDNLSKLPKNKFSDFSITIELPQSYNITKL